MPFASPFKKKTPRTPATPATPGAPPSCGPSATPGAPPPSWFRDESPPPTPTPTATAAAAANPFDDGGGANPFAVPRDDNPFAVPADEPAAPSGQPASPGGYDEPAEIAALEVQTAEHQLEIEAATSRMVRMAVETRDQGAATLGTMYEQGEQLRRIAGDQDRIQHNLDTSDKILKNMTSFLGWRTWGAKTPGKAAMAKGNNTRDKEIDDLMAKVGAEHPQTPVAAASAAGGAGPSSAWTPSRTPAGGEAGGGVGEGLEAVRPPEQDGLDMVGGLVSEMHQQALAMNTELKTQAGQIDTLIGTTDNERAQLAKATKTTARVGGRGAQRVMQRGQKAEAAAASSARHPFTPNKALAAVDEAVDGVAGSVASLASPAPGTHDARIAAARAAWTARQAMKK